MRSMFSKKKHLNVIYQIKIFCVGWNQTKRRNIVQIQCKFIQISTFYCRTQIYCIRTNMLITTFASLHGEIYRQCYEIFDSNLDQSAQPVLLMKTRVSVWRTFLVCKNIRPDGILAVKRHLRLNKILYTCKRNGFRV